MKWITIKFKTREITSAQLVFTWNLFQILPIREVQGSDKCDAATIYNNLNTFLYTNLCNKINIHACAFVDFIT